MYSIYQKLLDEKGLKNADVARATGISNMTLSDWKKGKSTPKQDKLTKISDFLGVTVDFLMGKTDKIRCVECGQVYNPIDELERSLHDTYHQKCIIARKKYPFLMDASYEAGLIECMEYESFKDSSLSDASRVIAFDRYLAAKFTLYLSRKGYELDGLSYEDFCKSEVSILEPSNSISKELIGLLAKRYDVDISMMDANSRLLARASNNQQLMRLLAYAEKLTPEMLNMLEIQAKALSEQNHEE